MLGRHGKRSAEEVDCDDEEEKTVTTSSPEKASQFLKKILLSPLNYPTAKD